METKITLKQGDITKESVDAIVNAANSGLLGGGGVDGAIHRAAGPSLLEECRKHVQLEGSCPPGSAVVTGAGRLSAKYVIHTVGPVWQGGSCSEAKVLASSYRNSLVLARSLACETIAFPAISTGVYRYPIEEAATIALAACKEFLAESENDASIKEIRFILFSQETLGIFSRVAKI